MGFLSFHFVCAAKRKSNDFSITETLGRAFNYPILTIFFHNKNLTIDFGIVFRRPVNVKRKIMNENNK